MNLKENVDDKTIKLDKIPLAKKGYRRDSAPEGRWRS